MALLAGGLGHNPAGPLGTESWSEKGFKGREGQPLWQYVETQVHTVTVSVWHPPTAADVRNNTTAARPVLRPQSGYTDFKIHFSCIY